MNSPVSSGQFVMIHWPFTDRSSIKRRPALFVEEPDVHGDLRVMKVTTRSPTESALVVTPEELAEGQLKTTSFLRLGHSLKLHEPLDKYEVALPSTLDFWTTTGKKDAAFRQEWALPIAINQP